MKHTSTVAARSPQICIVRSGAFWRAQVLGVLRLSRLGGQVKMISVSDVDPSKGSACASESWAVQQTLVTRAVVDSEDTAVGQGRAAAKPLFLIPPPSEHPEGPGSEPWRLQRDEI